MLLLSRGIGQSIMIGDDIKITVLQVSSHQVRIGIDAPRELPVHREEIYQRIQEEGDRNQKPDHADATHDA